MTAWVRRHPLISFFALAYLLAFAPLFGYIYFQPGQPLERWSLVWLVNVFSPTISAVLVSAVIGGWPEVKRVMSGFTRWKAGPGWYLAAAFLLLGPLVIALVYIALGNPASGLQPGVTLASLLATVFFNSSPVRSRRRRAGAASRCRGFKRATTPWSPA